MRGPKPQASHALTQTHTHCPPHTPEVVGRLKAIHLLQKLFILIHIYTSSTTTRASTLIITTLTAAAAVVIIALVLTAAAAAPIQAPEPLLPAASICV